MVTPPSPTSPAGVRTGGATGVAAAPERAAERPNAAKSRGRIPAAGQRGQATVEFALILIPFLLLLFGIFDLGRGILYYNMLGNAVRDGARAGITGSSAADIGDLVYKGAALPTVPTCDPPFPVSTLPNTHRFQYASGLTVDIHRGWRMRRLRIRIGSGRRIAFGPSRP